MHHEVLWKALDVFFHITHILIISFFLVGWAFKTMRKAHVVLVVLTLLSWVALGYFFGWGYCFWTDWHWQVREKLGKTSPASYIKLFVDSVTGIKWDAALIDSITVAVFALVLLATTVAFFRHSRKTA